MKVYTVWYMSEIKGGAHLWGIYGTQEGAEKEVEKSKKNVKLPHGGMKKRFCEPLLFMLGLVMANFHAGEIVSCA